MRLAPAVLTLIFLDLSSVPRRIARPLEAELDRLRRELRIPAMSAAVVESGTTVWVRHFGVKAVAGQAVRYPIASLTKPFSAVLALQLVERGKLRLDAVRHLLTQRPAQGHPRELTSQGL